ncbi:hypothetical protein HMN09_00983100 [Mycena chlorophos]|uniref:Uncharacterized protein n=1 Tax=Mycena chlorophos TaxID=658473 RepID=A0A8H6SK38_MYCCL|nr:hypothetical protein HMN09_00983100 [Mycena chlorophos]
MNSFHPYRRRPRRKVPAPKPGTALHGHLQQWNAVVDAGNIPTFNHQTQTVETIVRPHIEMNGRLVPTGVANIDPSNVTCPCTQANGEPYSHHVLKRGQGYEDYDHFVPPADAPNCVFKVPILKVRRRRVLRTQEEFNAWNAVHNDNSDSESSSSSPSPSSSTPASSTLTTPATSPQKATTVASAQSSSSLAIELVPDASVPPLLTMRARLLADDPHARYAGLRLDQGACTYPRTVAVARANVDYTLLDVFTQFHVNRTFVAVPDSHPFHPLRGIHVLLVIYDNSVFRGVAHFTLERTFANTALGWIISSLNSTRGVRLHAYRVAKSRMSWCTGCDCYFSPDGYKDHRNSEGECVNHPDLNKIPPSPLASPSEAEFQQRTYRDAAAEAREFESTLETPLGVAWAAVNSRLGLPADVWFGVLMAVQQCDDCGLVRTFPAHELHLRDGFCSDPGQELRIVTGTSDDDDGL